jgi:succinate dehydrogenase hydrophobic anchor subunit
VGGGFIRVPALIYIVGASTHIAVGTDLLEIAVSGGYGALRHSMMGNVDMIAVLFMIVGAMFGAQFGSIATAYVRGPAIRYILSYSLVLACVGAFLRLAYMLTGSKHEVLSFFAVVFTLGEMIFLCLFIIFLVYFSVRHTHGKRVPDWVPSLVVAK